MKKITPFNLKRMGWILNGFFICYKSYFFRLFLSSVIVLLLFSKVSNTITTLFFVGGLGITQLFVNEMQRNGTMFFMLPATASERIISLFLLNTVIQMIVMIFGCSVFYLLCMLITEFAPQFSRFHPEIAFSLERESWMFVFLYAVFSQSVYTLFMIKTFSWFKSLLYFLSLVIGVILFFSLIRYFLSPEIQKEVIQFLLKSLALIFIPVSWYLSYRVLKNKQVSQIKINKDTISL